MQCVVKCYTALSLSFSLFLVELLGETERKSEFFSPIYESSVHLVLCSFSHEKKSE